MTSYPRGKGRTRAGDKQLRKSVLSLCLWASVVCKKRPSKSSIARIDFGKINKLPSFVIDGAF